MRIKQGAKISAKDKLGQTSTWNVLGQNNRGYFILKAADETLETYKADLEELAKRNPFCEDLQGYSLDEFATIEVDAGWFRQRVIKEVA